MTDAHQWVLKSTAAALLVMGLFFGGVVKPVAVGNASPGHGDSWVDCAGPKLCTKYWSRAKTRELNDLTHSFAWGVMRVAGDFNPMMAAFNQSANTNLDGLESSTAAAVTHNACLQLAWRKDHKDSGTWGYTDSRDYCWNS